MSFTITGLKNAESTRTISTSFVIQTKTSDNYVIDTSASQTITFPNDMTLLPNTFNSAT